MKLASRITSFAGTVINVKQQGCRSEKSLVKNNRPQTDRTTDVDEQLAAFTATWGLTTEIRSIPRGKHLYSQRCVVSWCLFCHSERTFAGLKTFLEWEHLALRLVKQRVLTSLVRRVDLLANGVSSTILNLYLLALNFFCSENNLHCVLLSDKPSC